MPGDCNEAFEMTGYGKTEKEARENAKENAETACKDNIQCSHAHYVKRVKIRPPHGEEKDWEFVGQYTCGATID